MNGSIFRRRREVLIGGAAGSWSLFSSLNGSNMAIDTDCHAFFEELGTTPPRVPVAAVTWCWG